MSLEVTGEVRIEVAKCHVIVKCSLMMKLALLVKPKAAKLREVH